jgi:hypothetical protein
MAKSPFSPQVEYSRLFFGRFLLPVKALAKETQMLQPFLSRPSCVTGKADHDFCISFKGSGRSQELPNQVDFVCGTPSSFSLDSVFIPDADWFSCYPILEKGPIQDLCSAGNNERNPYMSMTFLRTRIAKMKPSQGNLFSLFPFSPRSRLYTSNFHVR